MDDSTLMKISFTLSILGIIAIYFISDFAVAQTDITIANAGDKINLKGKITDISYYNSSQVLEISPYTKTQVVVFQKASFNVGDSVEIIGKVDEYRGKKQVIADQIREI